MLVSSNLGAFIHLGALGTVCVCECVQGALGEGLILLRGTCVNQIQWDSCRDPKLRASLSSFRRAA